MYIYKKFDGSILKWKFYIKKAYLQNVKDKVDTGQARSLDL